MTATVEIHALAYNHHNTMLAVLSPGASLAHAYAYDGTHLVISEGDALTTKDAPK